MSGFLVQYFIKHKLSSAVEAMLTKGAALLAIADEWITHGCHDRTNELFLFTILSQSHDTN